MRYLQAGVMLAAAALYLAALAIMWMLIPTEISWVIPVVLIGWNVLLVAVAVLVAVDSRRKARAGRTLKLATDLLVVKVAAIPFFLINFSVLAWIAFFGSAITVIGDAVLETGGYIILIGALAVVLTYLAMLSTSTYGWAAIAQLRRDGRIGTLLAVLYRVMLLLFVTDVVVAVLLYVHARRAEGATAPVKPGSPTMKFVQAGTLLLGSVMYTVLIAVAGQIDSLFVALIGLLLVGVWNTLLASVTALVVVDGVRKVRAGETREAATAAFLVKLTAIPFFLLNVFVLSYLAAGGLAIFIFGGMALLFAAWIGIGLTYLAMLSTSVYLWAAIARLRRDGDLGSGLAVLYGFLSFVFVSDVVAAILAFGHSRKRPGLSLVIVSLVIGVILTLPGVIPLDASAFPFPSVFDGAIAVGDTLSIVGIAVIALTIVLTVIRVAVLRRSRSSSPADDTSLEQPDRLPELAADRGEDKGM